MIAKGHPSQHCLILGGLVTINCPDGCFVAPSFVADVVPLVHGQCPEVSFGIGEGHQGYPTNQLDVKFVIVRSTE